MKRVKARLSASALRSRPAMGTGETLPRLHALPFSDLEKLVAPKVLKGFHQATRPTHFKALDLGFLTQPEVNTEVVVREVTSSAAHLGDLFPIADLDCDARADGVPVALSSHQPECKPMVAVSAFIAEQGRAVIQIDDQDVQVAIAVARKPWGPTTLTWPPR